MILSRHLRYKINYIIDAKIISIIIMIHIYKHTHTHTHKLGVDPFVDINIYHMLFHVISSVLGVLQLK